MAYIFQSVFASEFKNFLIMIRDAGQQTRGYEATFKSLDIFISENPVQGKALTEETISRWLDSLSCKPQSKNRRITHVRVFSRYLNALEIPAFEPGYMREQSEYIPYTFTDEEFRAIIHAADEFLGNRRGSTKSSRAFPMLLRMLYGCGLRLGEALALRWENVDLGAGILRIKKAKNNKERDVPMDPSLTSLLETYKKRRISENPDSVYVFESDRVPGTPYLGWTFRNWFLSVMEQAGISNERQEKYGRAISPHTLRHYFTYKSFLQAEDKGRTMEQFIPYLSAYLGHRSLLETERYLATDYTLYKDSQERMEQSIGHIFPEVDFE